MTPKNPSEIQRLYEELEELQSSIKGPWPRVHKESILKQIRTIEDILELPHKPYNET